MQIVGRSSAAEFLSDFIVYRNLVPCDSRLPRFADFHHRLRLAAGIIPRKSEAQYGQAVAYLLQQARTLTAPGAQIRRLAFLGDTRLLDGTAFDNICQAGGWAGLAFIGAENEKPPAFEVVASPGGQRLCLSNRWTGLADFDEYCSRNHFPVDEAMVLVIDLDKTILGARGRNAETIDRARVAAVEETVADLLGDSYNAAEFRRSYDLLNQPEFHLFTADNQDYLAYICLVLGSGFYSLDEVVERVRAGELVTFDQFIEQVDKSRPYLQDGLARMHSDIYAAVLAGDPTPFKTFRRNEYRHTVGRFGCLPDHTSVEILLKEEITLTAEVRALALKWAKCGALVFGLSDKPDEASLPTPELAAQGYQPLHRAVTHVVGEFDQL